MLYFDLSSISYFPFKSLVCPREVPDKTIFSHKQSREREKDGGTLCPCCRNWTKYGQKYLLLYYKKKVLLHRYL